MNGVSFKMIAYNYSRLCHILKSISEIFNRWNIQAYFSISFLTVEYFLVKNHSSRIRMGANIVGGGWICYHPV